MIRNYLKLAWRNLWKNKLFSVINIISLAIGLSASFIIGLMVYHEFTFDKFHADADRIYRVTTNFISPNGTSYNSGVPSPLGDELRSGVPGIHIVNEFYTSDPSTVQITESGEKHKRPEYVIYTDENYFKLFEYNWIAGSSDELKGLNLKIN